MLLNIQYGEYLVPIPGDEGYQAFRRYRVVDTDTGEVLPRSFSFFGRGWVSPFGGSISLDDPQTTARPRTIRVVEETEESRQYVLGYDRAFYGKRAATDAYILRQTADWQDGYYQGRADRPR